jgi:hypothetical protein
MINDELKASFHKKVFGSMRIRVDPVEYGAKSRMTIRMIELHKRCEAFQR